MSEARFFRITPSGEFEHFSALLAALSSLGQGGYIWLDYADPTKEDLSALVGPLKIHPLSIEDCLDKQQIPKVDIFPGYTFLLFNRYCYAERVLSVSEVDFFIGKNFLVTVSGHGSAESGFHTRLEERFRENLGTAQNGPDFLLHTILDDTVDSKLSSIESLEDDIDSAEEAMIRDASTFQLEGQMHLRRALLSMRKSLFHEREILVKICRRDCPFISEATIYHFRDIYDHLTKFFELTEMNRDIVTSLTETYLSIVNNQMATVANRTNLSVRRLTLITTIFMPLTLLAGIGGMSEWSMMTGPENWRTAYPAFLAGMLCIAIINYYWLKRLQSAGKREST